MSIEDILTANKKQIYYEKSVIIDETNNMSCEITYNPNYNNSASGTAYRWTVGWIPSMNGLGKNELANRDARADDIHIRFYKNASDEEKKELVCEGHGSWTSYIEIGGTVMWKITNDLPLWKSKSKGISDNQLMLESDSQNRIDVPFIYNSIWEEAEKAKVELEELQRADKKLRVKAGEKRKK